MRSNPGGPDAAAVEETVMASEQPVYRQLVESLLSRGYQPSLELAEAAYMMLQIRRLRAVIEDERASAVRYKEAKAEAVRLKDTPGLERDEANRQLAEASSLRETTKQTWQALGDVQASLRAQLVTLDKKQAAAAAGDPEREFRQAEQWVQEHLGEFEARCPSATCGQILTLPALPHWAYAPVSTQDGLAWMVWSPELWALVCDQTISLWVMAYCLRISPEALKITAERRGEPWPLSIDLVAEERLYEIRLRAIDRAALALTP